MNQLSISNIPQTREKNYYKSVLTDSYYSKDIRIHNLSGYFKNKYNILWKTITEQREKLFGKGFILTCLSTLLSYSGLIFITVSAIINVVNGKMQLGDLALYTGIALSAANTIQIVLSDLGCEFDMLSSWITLYMDFLSWESHIEDNGIKEAPHNPEICFKNVCFHYPNSENNVINNLSFTIPRGKKIALIGVNGAGKSTIVKLLLRLYDPTDGEILIDGINIKEYSLSSLRSIFSVCFQDITKYALTLGENISISDYTRSDEKDEIDEIVNAAIISGADKIFSSWEDGVDTPLTRSFEDNGQELSGGQWQKIALSRAFFRNADIVILDEPSSALDPEAEDHIFSSFSKLCKNKGGILISHRLSSVMMVDEIVVIEDGHVVEQGTHSELINKNGRYAYLYKLQSEKYRLEVDKLE